MNGKLVDSRARSPISSNQRQMMQHVACRKHMLGICAAPEGTCNYSHLPEVCELELTKIRANMEKTNALQQVVVSYNNMRRQEVLGPKQSAASILQQHADLQQRLAHVRSMPDERNVLAHGRSTPTTLQHVAHPAPTQSRGVSWGNDELSARVAQLDVHYNRELAMLQQQAAGLNQNQSVLNLADGESDAESGYSSAGDF